MSVEEELAQLKLDLAQAQEREKLKEQEAEEYKRRLIARETEDAAAAGGQRNNETNDGKMIKDLFMAFGLMNMGKSDKAKDILKGYTGADVDSWISSLKDKGEEDDDELDIPEHLTPITTYGTTNNVLQGEKKWLRDTLNIKEKAKRGEKLTLEDVLQATKALHEEYNQKFSEGAVVKILLDQLSETQAADLRRYRSSGMSLRQAWKNLLTEYRTILTPLEAQAEISKITENLETPVLQNLERIKYLSGLATGENGTMKRTAVHHGKTYLEKFADTNMVSIIYSFVQNAGASKDPWTVFIREVKARIDDLENAREMALAKGKKKSTVSAIRSEDDDKEKEVNRLKSELGTTKKKLNRVEQLLETKEKEEEDRRDRGGYGQRRGNWSNHRGRNDRRPGPSIRLANEAYRQVKNKCWLCGADGHEWPDCDKYAGARVMTRLCMNCNEGCHHSNSCKKEAEQGKN